MAFATSLESLLCTISLRIAILQHNPIVCDLHERPKCHLHWPYKGMSSSFQIIEAICCGQSLQRCMIAYHFFGQN
jgi:hypothetical protein